MARPTSSTVTVASGGAKSAFIDARALVALVQAQIPVVGMFAPSAVEALSAKLRWYASPDGSGSSEVPITDESGNDIVTTFAVDTAIELDVKRFLRWPYLLFEIVKADGTTAVNQAADRVFTLSAESL